MPVAESDEVKKTFNWPQAVSLRLQELDNELKDEEVTKKGFYNRKYAIVQEYLVKDQVDKVVEIKASFKEGNLTDTEYYKKMDELLIPSQEFVDDGASAEEEDKENQPLFPVKDEKEEKMETEEAASGSGSSSTVKEESSSSKVKEESSSSSGKALRPRPEKNQRSITDMFKNAPKKRTLENEDSAESEAKKIKVAKIQRCKICRQDTCNPDLLCYETHPDGAKEEMEAIFDPKILLESEDGIGDQMPNYKITSFTVYCKEGHVVRFDTDLIENGKDLYFSGFIKAVWSEDPTVDDESVPVKDAGPITSWWNAGYDGGDKPVTGFSTVYAEYYLMSPSDLYKPIMTETDEKIFLTKHVIEYLEKCVDPAGALGQEYEDMTNYLSVQVPKEGMGELNEEMLIKHADFVVHQVYSYEDAGDEEGQEVKFLPLPCVKDLIKLAGIKLSGRKKALRMKKPATKMMPKHTDATVTPAVRQVFEMVFGDQMRKEDDKAVKKARMQRCGMCENCLKSDCGKCRHCLDMTKFGGSGRSKQACMERKCLNKGIKGEDAEESDEEEPEPEISPSKKESEKVTHKSRDTHKDVEWVGSGAKEGRKTYYTSAILDGNLTICIGDTVLIQPDQSSIPLYIAKVSNMYDGPDGATAHVQWFGRGMDTILGEAGDPSELFLLTDCEDQPLLSIWKKCNVQHLARADQADWRKEGGQEPREVMKDDGVNFWYRFHYTPTTARFTYPDPWPENPDCDSCHSFCGVCIQKQLDEDRWLPKVHEKTETLDIASLFWDQAPLKIGDCVYLSPNSVPLKIKKNRDVKETSIKKNVDEDLYPEYYRKRSHVKGNNNTTPDPFHVVMIKKIFKDCGEVKLRVQIFYRPEDTHKGSSAADNAYYNELYWTEEEATVAFSNVQGRCFVKFMDMNVANKQLEVWTEEGPNRWFFREWYNLDTKDTEEPPLSAQRIGHKGKGGKGGKGKGKSSAPKTEENVDKKDTETSPDYPPVAEPLKCLDIFSGCGGLSQGLHESGVAESKWAVEIFEPAAKAYKLNNKDCTVFGDDCNLLLARAIEGVGQNEKGQKIPTQGEVDLLCGGPPCQGFSGMNRFNSREYSQFKNSLVSTYLSYCDYYRPKYFILENVKNFASYKKGMVLKLCLTTLIKMGYQCSFAVLQAGQFGVAQTRRRAIILAAAPGEKLPLFPEPQHVFSPQACSLSVQIDEVRYESNVRWTSSAPYRTCTVRDTMSDLPKIGNGEDKLERSYGGEAKSHFQKNIRKGSEVLRDHITKNMAPLIVARFELIPTAPGSDWRDLPNKVVKLSDDITKGPVKKLRYMFDDKMQGRGPNGQLRGVCSCADGKTKCEAVDKQDRTLIPWCLPHTGNRHNHWAGLYGRVEWDGFFSTTITNPEPMGKQGRVLHPDQHRVVSVRECARSQGFPDTYRFYGSVLDKHRQIGNAVPPPMGRALGLQIRQAMAMSK